MTYAAATTFCAPPGRESFRTGCCVGMSDFNVWAEVEPPKGTVYNYPIRPWHNSLPSISGFPAPPEMAIPMFNRATIPTMWAKLYSGQSVNQVIAWAKDEIEGFIRYRRRRTRRPPSLVAGNRLSLRDSRTSNPCECLARGCR